MKVKNALFILFALLLPISAKSQTRILFGGSGGQQFDNTSFGVSAGIEIPLRRLELDASDTFSPIQKHTGLGSGRANIVRSGCIVWLTKSFGVTGNLEYSQYAVTNVSKGATYGLPGVIIRTKVLDTPVRFGVYYIRQVNNGIQNGVETSHLNGGEVTASWRLGCFGFGCIRLDESLSVGRVLTQGNPQCDGTLGNGSQIGFSPCPRSAAISGGATGGIRFEFPRRKAIETDVF